MMVTRYQDFQATVVTVGKENIGLGIVNIKEMCKAISCQWETAGATHQLGAPPTIPAKFPWPVQK